MTDNTQSTRLPAASLPGRAEIDGLILRAARHPLGVAFLRDGALDAVAATFGVHAFVVDAARDSLAKSHRLGGAGAASGAEAVAAPAR